MQEILDSLKEKELISENQYRTLLNQDSLNVEAFLLKLMAKNPDKCEISLSEGKVSVDFWI
jgi:hypothetical protein